MESAKRISRIAWIVLAVAAVVAIGGCAAAGASLLGASQHVPAAAAKNAHAKDALLHAQNAVTAAKKTDTEAEAAYNDSASDPYDALSSAAAGAKSHLRQVQIDLSTWQADASKAKSNLAKWRLAEASAQSDLTVRSAVSAMAIVILLIAAAGFHLASLRAAATVWPQPAD